MASLNSQASAKELLGIPHGTSLEASMLPEEHPRWQRVRPTTGSGVDLRDRFRGALIGGAIGDAMGRANDGRSASEARAGRVRDYQPWAKWSGGPKGTITDDTQEQNSSTVRWFEGSGEQDPR